MEGRFKYSTIPRFQAVFWGGVAQVPAGESVAKCILVTPQGNVEIFALPGLAPEKEVERPPARNPPWRLEPAEGINDFFRVKWFPGPQRRVIEIDPPP